MADKCLPAGRVLYFTGKRRWRASKDDAWATTNAASQVCGKLVGTRMMDGIRVAVVKGSNGTFYTELPGVVERREKASKPEGGGET